jgi:hypothetical protein
MNHEQEIQEYLKIKKARIAQNEELFKNWVLAQNDEYLNMLIEEKMDWRRPAIDLFLAKNVVDVFKEIDCLFHENNYITPTLQQLLELKEWRKQINDVLTAFDIVEISNMHYIKVVVALPNKNTINLYKKCWA